MLGWIIWTLLFIILISLSMALSTKFKYNQSTHKQTLNVILCGWAVLITFLLIDTSKVHILWVYPAVIVLIIVLYYIKVVVRSWKGN